MTFRPDPYKAARRHERTEVAVMLVLAFVMGLSPMLVAYV